LGNRSVRASRLWVFRDSQPATFFVDLVGIYEYTYE